MKTPNLHSFKIDDQGQIETPAMIPAFFTDQPLLKLEKLAIWNLDFEDFAEVAEPGEIVDIQTEKLQTINIPLKNLSLQSLKVAFKGPENVMAFLNRFTLTLEELNLGKFSPPLPEGAYEIIFSKFHRLKLLRVNTEKAPKDVLFYGRLQSNPSVTKLIIDDTKLENKIAIQTFLEKLPNIETLIINSESINGELLNFINTQCSNLKHLAVKKFFNITSTLHRLRMDNVVSLTVCEMKYVSPESWKKFHRTFCNLESLSIHETDEVTLNSQNFNIFTKGLKKIKHFLFGAGFKAVKRVFNQMLKNCKQLQSVEVFESSFGGDSNLMDKIKYDFKMPGLRFICYDTEDHEICKDFDHKFGVTFWRHRRESPYSDTCELTDDEFNSDDDEDNDSDDDYDDLWDSDYEDDDSDNPMDVVIRMLAQAAHGPGEDLLFFIVSEN
jgi:hypothetical protein